MLPHDRRDSGEVPRGVGRRSSRRLRSRRIIGAVSPVALAWSLALTYAAPSVAAPGTQLDVDPEVANVWLGQDVTLTANVRDADGNSVGAGTHVRWYFGPGSPNDPDSGNSSP